MRRRGLLGPLVKGLIFTVVTVLATAVLGITIANTGVGNTLDYYARFTDVTGLVTGDDISIAGVRVGQVEQISVVDRRVAQVKFSVEADHPLPASVTAVIRYRNLVGERYVELDQGPGAVDAMLPPGGTIPLARTQPALDLTDLFNGFKPLFQALSPNDVNQLSGEIIQVLQGEGGTVADLVSQTASLTTTLANRDKVIGSVIDNLNSVLNTVNARGGELGGLVTTLQQLVSGLAADREPIGNAITAMSQLANSTAGLLQQGRAPLAADISGLGQLSANLADNSGLVNQFLANLPIKYQAVGTLAAYGSWLNLYLCAATVTGVQTKPPSNPPPSGLPITEARCTS